LGRLGGLILGERSVSGAPSKMNLRQYGWRLGGGTAANA
jgi:hypothetical protein